MPLQIVRNDITKVKVDVIVNTANPKPVYASGTDGAIYAAAGKEKLLAARKEIGDISVGDIAVTPAFDLNSKYIIHTVGPAWFGGECGEFDALCSCYMKSLIKAKELGCNSIAFPLISTGVYGFPKDKALQIAINTITQFLLENEMKVLLVVFDRKSFELSGKLFDGVDAFIDEYYVREQSITEYSAHYETVEYFEQIERRETNRSRSIIERTDKLDDLEDLLRTGATFQQRLFQLIDEKGLNEVSVYKKANLSRKVFSKIRSNVDYTPKKKTALALAIAMELDLQETEDLLGRAEMALSPSSKFDLIIKYFILNKKYDVMMINESLFEHNQPLIGE